MTNRVAHGYYPWAKMATHTLPIRVGCPWADVPMGRIAGLIRGVLDVEEALLPLLARFKQLHLGEVRALPGHDGGRAA
jgi:hypothetical protein